MQALPDKIKDYTIKDHTVATKVWKEVNEDLIFTHKVEEEEEKKSKVFKWDTLNT